MHAVGTFVTAVAEGLELTGFGDRAVGIDLEVGAGEIVEQDVVAGTEEPGPAFLEMGEECLAVNQQSVVTAVKGVDGGKPEVVLKQVRHGTAVEPR